MAGNKKIFDLPLRTGVTADDRLAIVDSGNTTTYSVKLSDLQDGTGVNTLESLTGNITFSGTNIDVSTNGQTIVLSGSTGGGGGGTSYFSADTTNTTNITEINRGTTFDYCSVSPSLLDSMFVAGGINNTIRAGFTGCANAATQPIERFVMLGGNGNTLGTYQGFNSSDAFMLGGSNNSAAYGYPNAGVVGGNSNGISYGDNVVIAGGQSHGVAQDNGFIGGGFSHSLQNNNSGIVGGYDNYLRSTRSFIGGGTLHNVQAYGNVNNGIIGGNSHDVDAVNNTFIGGGDTHILRTCDRSAIIAGQNHTLSGHSNSVIIGGSGLTSNYNDEVQVPNLTIANYSSLNFSGDTAAAAGGIVLGQVYHDNGALRVRIT